MRISPAAVAHGSLSVKIQEDTKLLSEGTGTVVGTSATVAGTTATTAQETDIEIDQQQQELLFLTQVLNCKL